MTSTKRAAASLVFPNARPRAAPDLTYVSEDASRPVHSSIRLAIESRSEGSPAPYIPSQAPGKSPISSERCIRSTWSSDLTKAMKASDMLLSPFN